MSQCSIFTETTWAVRRTRTKASFVRFAFLSNKRLLPHGIWNKSLTLTTLALCAQSTEGLFLLKYEKGQGKSDCIYIHKKVNTYGEVKTLMTHSQTTKRIKVQGQTADSSQACIKYQEFKHRCLPMNSWVPPLFFQMAYFKS